MFNIAATFLLLSGIASLTYQVVWVRLLGLSMGSTSASISTVLAAFFLGLALGSYLAEKITRNRIDNLNVYIILELIIGLSGLLLLPVLLNLDAYIAAVPALSGSIVMKFVLTIVLLIIPTMCMGATFPVMASILIRRKNEVGVRVSQLYSLNTAGAVLGAALAGFVFVPNWGLDGAIYIAFVINICIVAMALYLNNRIKLEAIDVAETTSSNNDDLEIKYTDSKNNIEDAPLRNRALIVLFATGLVAIATEVGWTKYLSIFTGTTIYGFAAILTIFLMGIAIGSWVIKSYLARLQQPQLWMSIGLVLLGGTLLLTRASLVWIPALYDSINHIEAASWVMQALKYLVVFVLLFPATFLFGALFPLNLKLYCGNLQGVRARIGKAYAINTMASIFGSLIAGFWIIPEYGTDVLLTFMAFILLIVPLAFIPVINGQLSRVAVTAVTVVFISSHWLLPRLSYEELISSVQFDYQAYAGEKPEYLFLKEGKAGVISMITFDGRYATLQNNGLNESVLDMKDENNLLLVESLLGLVPYMLHKDPKSAFVVGFGGGVTTKALTLTPLESIRVVELEPAVVEAGRAIVKGEISALQDLRVKLNFNDARNTLLIEKNKYDIIASQPSHPWLARASNVFSQDFFTLVKSRLNENGIYAQWVSLFQMDATTLKSIMKGFYQVFPQGMTFADLSTGDFIMLGSNSPMIFDFDKINQHLNEPKVQAVMKNNDINNANDLMLYFALSREQALTAAGDVPANTDLNILSEVRLSKNVRIQADEENPYKFLWKQYTFDVKSYFSDDYKQRMYELGSYYMNNKHAVAMARHIAAEVNRLDPVLGRSLSYEKLWRYSDYKGALALYKKHNVWPDQTHIQQALILRAQGRTNNHNNKLIKTINRIREKNIRHTVKTKLSYERNDFTELLALKTKGDLKKMWRLVGMSQ